MYVSCSAAQIRSRILGLMLCPVIVALFSLPASAEILKITVDDTIQPVSQEYIVYRAH